jgi:hypothetical protein
MMTAGELLTRGTIWISIVMYAVGAATLAQSRLKFRSAITSPNESQLRSESGSASCRLSRLAWTIACLSLIVHAIFAFQFYHGWSHHAAYLETARQTNELTGLNWGGGLFINYLVIAVWTVDIAWWWLSGLGSYLRRHWLLLITWHGFLIFVIFNATVVFKDGTARWLGLLLCLIMVAAWTVIWSRRRC